MTKIIGVVHLRGDIGKYLDRVADGERFIVQRFSRPIAALVPISDLERLEGKVSEQQSPYGAGNLPPTAGTLDEAAQDLADELLDAFKNIDDAMLMLASDIQIKQEAMRLLLLQRRAQ